VTNNKNNEPTGFLAKTELEYSTKMNEIFDLYLNDFDSFLKIQKNAREKSFVYSEENFSKDSFNSLKILFD
jgi:hypothetical protein